MFKLVEYIIQQNKKLLTNLIFCVIMKIIYQHQRIFQIIFKIFKVRYLPDLKIEIEKVSRKWECKFKTGNKKRKGECKWVSAHALVVTKYIKVVIQLAKII